MQGAYYHLYDLLSGYLYGADAVLTGDQTLTLTLKMPQGSQIIKINLWEAKIAGREKVTVPAGTFDCLKVCYLQRTSAAGNVDKSYVTDWYAEGVGTVRSEVATEKNGEPVAVNVLKSIVRPQ